MDWKKVLGDIAPTIGAAFGPLGAAGGVAIKELLGVPGASDEDAMNLLQTPDGIIKIKQIEADYKTKMAQIQLDSDKSTDADRMDARARDTKLRQAGYKNTRADVMIVVVAFALCLDITLLSLYDLKPEVIAIFNMMVGALLKMLGDAFQFEFGSSRGSKEKDLLK